MEEGQVRVGLAGFGMSGQVFHAPFLAADPRFALKKVYERSTDHAKRAYPQIELVRSFEGLLTPDIDLVVITTPNQYHVPMAAQAVRAGKHVITEKPVAAQSGQAAGICRLARECGVLFSVYQNRRLDGDFLTVKKLVEAGRLGDVLDYECHFDRFVQGPSKKPWKRAGGEGVDTLYDLGIHLIDQAYALFGMPDEVYADLCSQRPESPGVDRFTVSLYYPGKKAVLAAGEVVAMPGPRFMVHGTRGSFLKYGQDPQESRLLGGQRPGGPDWGRDDPDAFGTLCTAGPQGLQRQAVETEIGNYGLYYDNFYKTLCGEETLMVNPEECVEVLRILEAAQRSSAQKRRIGMASGEGKERGAT